MGTWTLAVDESGRFEPGSTGEAGADERIVIGGVVFPGEAQSVDAAWTKALRGACKDLKIHFPPHANELKPEVRDELLEVACRELSKVGGEWIFVTEAVKGASTDLALYARMLGELIDAAARLVSRHGGYRLDVRPGQRTIPLSAEEAAKAEKTGQSRGETTEDGRVLMRTQTVAEVRQVFESIRREDVGLLPKLPEQGTVEVIAATSRDGHPALQFADVATNRIRSLLLRPSSYADRQKALRDVPVTLASRDALRRLRAMDRHLRSTPVNLVAAARERFRATSKEQADHAALQESAVHAFATAWRSGLDALASQIEKQGAEAIAHSLWAAAEMHLVSKSGSYEGVWLALNDAWAGDGALPSKLRQQLSNRELSARLWRVTLECANHRGDTDAAQHALTEFNAVLAQGLSLVLVAEQLHVTNLDAVRVQNALPCSLELLDSLKSEVLANAEKLLAAADTAGDVLGLAAPGAKAVAAPTSDAESALWRAAGVTPSWQAPDRERGRTYGTAARSYAFLGKLDEARTQCLRARTFFGDFPFDLRFNAAVLARIELERARLAPKAPASPLLSAALELAGITSAANFGNLAEGATKTPAIRFSLDLLLRSLLWTVADQRLLERTVKALKNEKVYNALSSSELRTHPTELVSRHAAELLGPGNDARRWIDLSTAVSAAAPDDSAIRRFGEFTRRALDGADGPAGSLTNPTFEYR